MLRMLAISLVLLSFSSFTPAKADIAWGLFIVNNDNDIDATAYVDTPNGTITGVVPAAGGQQSFQLDFGTYQYRIVDTALIGSGAFTLDADHQNYTFTITHHS